MDDIVYNYLDFLNESRVDFVKNDFMKKSEDGEEIFNQLIETDPTNKKVYLSWVANNYLKGNIKLEELSDVRKFLTNFDKYKNNLEQKDINQYKLTNTNFEDNTPIKNFYNSIEEIMKAKGVDEEGSFKGGEILHREGNIMIIHPTDSKYIMDIGVKGGWCLRDSGYAATMLEKYGIFILDNNKPVFALQYVEKENKIDDIQGKFNSVWNPQYDKFVTIAISKLGKIEEISGYNDTFEKAIKERPTILEAVLGLDNVNLKNTAIVSYIKRGVKINNIENYLNTLSRAQLGLEVSDEEIKNMSFFQKMVTNVQLAMRDERFKIYQDLSSSLSNRKVTEEEGEELFNNIGEKMAFADAFISNNTQLENLLGLEDYQIEISGENFDYDYDEENNAIVIEVESDNKFYEYFCNLNDSEVIMVQNDFVNGYGGYDTYNYISGNYMQKEFFRYLSEENQEHVRKIAKLTGYTKVNKENEDASEHIEDAYYEMFEHIDKNDIPDEFMMEISYEADKELEKRREQILSNVTFEVESSGIMSRKSIVVVDFKTIANNILFGDIEAKETLGEQIVEMNDLSDENIEEMLSEMHAFMEVQIPTVIQKNIENKLEDLIFDLEDEESDISIELGEKRTLSRDIERLNEILDDFGFESEGISQKKNHRIKKIETEEHIIEVLIDTIQHLHNETIRIERRVTKKGEEEGEFKPMNVKIDELNMYLQPNLFESNKVFKFKELFL